MMRTIRWNAKRLGVAAALVCVLYVVFSASRQTYESEALVRKTPPQTVWDFVADFSNMRRLNPTILSFTITEDTGNTHHWRYGVQYEERLSHWPYWLNRSTAQIAVKQIINGELSGKGTVSPAPVEYVIESMHQTCFMRGWYCLNSLGTFTFVARGPDTLCRETVTYQCPPFMGGMCRREVAFQREAIMRNLAEYFANKRNV